MEDIISELYEVKDEAITLRSDLEKKIKLYKKIVQYHDILDVENQKIGKQSAAYLDIIDWCINQLRDKEKIDQILDKLSKVTEINFANILPTPIQLDDGTFSVQFNENMDLSDSANWIMHSQKSNHLWNDLDKIEPQTEPQTEPINPINGEVHVINHNGDVVAGAYVQIINNYGTIPIASAITNQFGKCNLIIPSPLYHSDLSIEVSETSKSGFVKNNIKTTIFPATDFSVRIII